MMSAKSYTPRARLMGGMKWNEDKDEIRKRYMEVDWGSNSPADSLPAMLKIMRRVSEQIPLTNINNNSSGAGLTEAATSNVENQLFASLLDLVITSLRDYQGPPLNDHDLRGLFHGLSVIPLSRRYSYKVLNGILDLGLSVDTTARTNILRRIGRWPFYGHTGAIHSVAVSHDGSRIASASGDKSMRVWDAGTGDSCSAPLTAHTSSVRSVAFSPDGARLVSGSLDGTLRVWDVRTRQEAPMRHTEWVRSVAFSLDGKRVVSGSDDRMVRVWDANGTGDAEMESFSGHAGWISSVAFSPDGRLIASGSSDNTIRVWNTGSAQTNDQAISLEGHSDQVNSVAFSPDGTRIVSGSDDRTIRIWDVKTGQLVMPPLQDHTKYVMSVTYSPNGIHIISGSSDYTIRVWDAVNGKAVNVLQGHTDIVRSVAVTPDGAQIVSGSLDGTIRVWDMATGEQLLGPVEGWDDLE
ncbi:hypothetical protein HGRIS_013743 [Hohenbuehelia grisea]|uniref:WD40 repeat-like protein n=1 Tax=Hohenbuehelia grisea TaxID=104357 RepID=A0ABR3IWE8_9AGAR